jgi:hypothetical protein
VKCLKEFPRAVSLGGGINAAKRSAVSTGPLSALLHVHARPIDLLVWQEPVPHKGPEACSCGGLRA